MTADRHTDKRRARRLARALKAWTPPPAAIGAAPTVAAFMAAAATARRDRP